MTVPELEGASGREPIGAPTLETHSLSSDPVTNDVAIVGIQVVVIIVPVNVMSTDAARCERIGIHSLGAKIQLAQAGHARRINAGAHRGSLKVVERGSAGVKTGGVVHGHKYIVI